jgi:signal transduction histidine kinase/AraC-like DNA-binding protein/ligand-binding sensor domain-containing protein
MIIFKKGILSCFLLLAVSAAPHICMAAAYDTEHFGLPSGLKSERHVRVIQDQRGFYWFGSLKGLQRFDGYVFKEFPVVSSSGFPATYEVHKLFIANDTLLLVGTSAGLLEFSEKTQQFRHIQFPGEDHYRVTDICAIDSGRFFLNSHTRKGVFEYNLADGIVRYPLSGTDSLMRSPNIRLVIPGSGTHYYFHIGYDIYRYCIGNDVFTKLHLGDIPANAYAHYGHTDKNGVFWLLGGTGLYYLDSSDAFARVESLDHYCPLNKQIGSAIIQATDSSVYVGLNWWGIAEICTSSKQVLKVLRKSGAELSALASNQIYHLYLSADKSLWWCSNGAYRISEDNSGRFFLKSGQSPDAANYSVLDIIEDKHGTVWVGTDGGGLHIYSPGTGTTVPASEIYGNKLPLSKVVMCIYEDKASDELWLGTYGEGAYRFNRAAGAEQHLAQAGGKPNAPGSRIWDIIADGRGRILVSTLCKSVNIYDKQTGAWARMTAENRDIRDNCVTVFAPADEGLIWFGYTEAGIDAYNPLLGRMAGAAPATPDRVLSILAEPSMLVLGCFYGLRFFCTQTSSFIHHPAGQAFAGKRINCVYKDSKHRYWVAAEHGLYSFLWGDSLAALSPLDTYFNDNSVKKIIGTQCGRLLFGGTNGLLSVPEELAGGVPVTELNIHITDFRLFGETAPAVDSKYGLVLPGKLRTIKLPYNKNYIGISFSALNITASKNISYAIKVDNFYPGWTDIKSGENQLELPNLQPGKYTVYIKAINKGSQEVLGTRSLQIEISPPFWQTAWFILIVCLAAASAIGFKIKNIRDSSRRLSAMVDEKTAQLKEANLKLGAQFQSMKESKMFIEIKNRELAEAIELKDKIAGVIGHDFRNTLSGLSNYSQLLKNNYARLNTDKLGAYINTICDISSSLSIQMTKVLDWAQLQMDTVAARPVSINIELLLADAVQLSAFPAKAKKIAINIFSQYESCGHVDPHLASTILRNLLSNAIKFTPAGGRIDISIVEKSAGIEVSFSDTGQGIEQEKLDSIMQAYSPQYLSLGTGNEKGVGFGLQVAKSFAHKTGAQLRISSHVGRGTLAEVLFPKSAIPAAPIGAGTDALDAPAPDAQLSGVTILIAEDNAELLLLLEQAFASCGVYTSADGAEAFLKAKELLPDIIISDINMPNSSGLELCKHIRECSITSHIPIILLTGEKNPGTREQAYSLGAVDFVEKPFDIGLLLQKVSAFLDNRRKFMQSILSKTLAPGTSLPESCEDELVRSIMDYISNNYADTELDADKIAEATGLSKVQLWRKLKAVAGKTPGEVIKDHRLARAAEMLRSGKYRISEVAFQVGFSDQRYFSRVFLKEFGCTPTEYMNSQP